MRRRTLCLSLAAIALAPIAHARPAGFTSPLSPRNANYSIIARLAASRTITGSEIIKWRNITTKAVSDRGFNQFSTARTDAQAYDPNFLPFRYFGGFVPYVFKDIVLSRRIDGDGLLSYRQAAKSDAQSTPSFTSARTGVTNNSKTLEPKGSEAAMKWSMTWMVWLQDCLLSCAVFV